MSVLGGYGPSRIHGPFRRAPVYFPHGVPFVLNPMENREFFFPLKEYVALGCEHGTDGFIGRGNQDIDIMYVVMSASEGTRDAYLGNGRTNQRTEMACERFRDGPGEVRFFGSPHGLSGFLFKGLYGGFHGATGCDCDGTIGAFWG